MSELFIADVHLDRNDRRREGLFVRFCDEVAADVSRLYILGDLFNFWMGPSEIESPGYRRAIEALARLHERGCEVRLIVGNRDFHIRDELPRATGLWLHRRGIRRTAGGRREYLCHGDSLCTTDIMHHLVKWVLSREVMVRFYTSMSEAFKLGLGHLHISLSGRFKKQAKKHAHRIQTLALEKLFRDGVDTVICGHVHRQCHRTFRGPEGRRMDLYVVGPWNDCAPYLAKDGERFEFREFR